MSCNSYLQLNFLEINVSNTLKVIIFPIWKLAQPETFNVPFFLNWEKSS